MGSLSSLYDLSRGALQADQVALTTTANNVANQNTVGYTRQVVTFASGADRVTLSDGAIASANAPEATVSSARDRVLEQRVQQQTQLQAGTSAQATALSQLEAVFSISGSSATVGSTQIGTAIDGFFSSLTALTSNPSDSSTRQAVLTAAGTLAQAFNAGAQQISSVAAGINSGVASSVTAVNSLTATIAGLNAQIQSQSPNTDAGALEDQRQTAIAQLSQYIGLDQISTESNGIALTTASGATLVSGTKSYDISSAVVGGSAKIYDSTGADITAGITGGSIGGQLAAQGGALTTASTALDALAYRIATAVNTQNEAGLNGSGSAAGAIFTVPSSSAGAAGALVVSATSVNAIASAGSGEGVTGNTNALALAAIATGTDANGATIDGSFAALLSQVGSSSSSLQAQSTAQQATLTALTSQRDSLSAVSLDEEAANLSQYQRSYDAAAKLFSIVDSVTVTALNLGEEVAVQ
ncbi:flagellar hook-associated protein FlgK [Granulicella tundricola]|uniref:Flagellar hook-associated protein 1 n=1 Tax=Granulicella tundricola (strain ATCC BAA-1859 / DSM 23138 / MP5ACTX9) TaxID=1198114 RepID=E8X3U9_GRATM|nr:flagellar hook-associated protein FlgK [Granulicella tundricola]ADW69377.1 flagellar hook-associated protein FlgK [Granulicella tundricola MP5ACTX9]